MMPISSMLAFPIGLSRLLLPFFYLQNGIAPQWFPPLAHLAYHISSIAGTFIGPTIFIKLPFTSSSSDLHFHSSVLFFLSALLKCICLFLFTICLQFNNHSSQLLFLFPIFGIGIADGIGQRHLVIDALKSGKLPMIQILVQYSAASLFAAFTICATFDAKIDYLQQIIPQMPFQFSVQPKMLFGGLIIFQTILLFPLLPIQSPKLENDEPIAQENSPISIQTHEMPSQIDQSINPPKIGFTLLVPICLICAISAALFEGIPFAIFPFMNSNEFGQKRNDFVLFSAFALFACLCLAFTFLPAQMPQSQFISWFSSPNAALFPIGLFGSGFALCTLNAPNFFHQFSISIYGASLSLIMPAILLHFSAQFDVSISVPESNLPPPGLLPILFSSQIGPLLFPFILAQIFSAYGGPQLYTSIALLAILLMVIAFVCILNAQAEQQQNVRSTKRENLLFEWFRGNGGKRTRRSIHRFVRNFRGNLRRRQTPALAYGRCQKRRRIGTANNGLLEENPIAADGRMRNNYQSIQQGIDNGQFVEAKKENQIEEINKFELKGSLAIRRARFPKLSLPSIIVHPQSTENTENSKSMQIGALGGERKLMAK